MRINHAHPQLRFRSSDLGGDYTARRFLLPLLAAASSGVGSPPVSEASTADSVVVVVEAGSGLARANLKMKVFGSLIDRKAVLGHSLYQEAPIRI